MESKDFPGVINNARKIKGKIYFTQTVNLPFDSIFTENYYQEILGKKQISDERSKDLLYNAIISEIPALIDSFMQVAFSNFSGNLDESYCQNIIPFDLYFEGTDEQKVELEKKGILTFPIERFLNITTFDFKKGLDDLKKTGAFATANTFVDSQLYAQEDLIVISDSSWGIQSNGKWGQIAYLTAFLNREGNIKPLATGTVNGYAVNTQSMDFYNGYFRSLTVSKYEPIEPTMDVPIISFKYRSYVTSFQFKDNRFIQKGQIETSSVFGNFDAARFMDEKVFLISIPLSLLSSEHLQIERLNLITIDLSDQDYPKFAKLLRYSKVPLYLHSIDKNHILVISRKGEYNVIRPFDGALQISLFDISNLANPIEIHQYVGDKFFSTFIKSDNHAFLYLPEKKRMVMPISFRDSEHDFSVFDVSIDSGINLLGTITHEKREGSYNNCLSTHHLPVRNIVVDNQLITYKELSIKSHDIDTLDKNWEIDLEPDLISNECPSAE